MINLKQIYESFLLENIKDDAIKKFGENSQDYVNKFWNEIRAKENDIKKKDINFWMKEGFDAFKEYVDNFKSKKEEKKSQYYKTEVDGGKGKLLKVLDGGYELWKVDSYNAAKELGRNYKNNPSKWCISSNTNEHWIQYYEKEDTRFYFLIREEKSNNNEDRIWDKVAIEVEEGGKDEYDYLFWDIDDNAEADDPSSGRIVANLPRYLQTILLQCRDEIKWYEVKISYNIKNYVSESAEITYENDGSINIKGNVSFHNENFKKLPFKFNRVEGSFECSSGNIISLEGCPKYVKDSFDCSWNSNLVNLKYSPSYVGGTYNCNGCGLIKNLEGVSEHIGYSFFCERCNSLENFEGFKTKIIKGSFKGFSCNKLKSLKGLSIDEILGDFDVSYSDSLLSLEFSPKDVKGSFLANGCSKITNLKGSPKYVNMEYYCSRCHSLASFEGAPDKIMGAFWANDCPRIKSLKGLKHIEQNIHIDQFTNNEYREYIIANNIK